MIIFTDYNKPYVIDDLYSPVVPRHFWVFNGLMQDFTLSPIMYLEETSGPTFEIEVDGVSVLLPASWHLLVTDDDHYKVDTVRVSDCSKNRYHALLMTDADNKVRTAEIRVVDYFDHKSLIHPMLDKENMLCHPISDQMSKNKHVICCLCAGPADLSAKHLVDISVSELFY